MMRVWTDYGLVDVSDPVTKWLAFVCLLVGMAFAATPVMWKKTKLLAVLVHEVSHVSAAVLTGRRVTCMRVHGDTSGSTNHVGVRGLGHIITAFAGYPGPALLGFALCAAVATSYLSAAVAGLLVISVFLLPIQHSWRGFVITCSIAGVAVLLMNYEPSSMFVAYGFLVVGGYMLMASPLTIVELHRLRIQEKTMGRVDNESGVELSDSESLARMTHIPAVLWEALFMMVSVAAAGLACWLLAAGVGIAPALAAILLLNAEGVIG